MQGGELLEVFLQEAWEGLVIIEAGIGELRTGGQESDDVGYASVGLVAHRLRGSAGLYGYPQLAGLSALGERLVESRPQLSSTERERLLDVLELVTLGLRRALNDIGSGHGEGEVGLHFAQIGGAASLQALLRATPLAFKARQTPEQTRQASDPAAVPATSQGLPATDSRMDADLRNFARDNNEIWSYFAPEVREYLDTLRAELDRNAQEGEYGDVTLMFRAAHTIKGSAFMVGLNVMGDLAHRLEDLLSAIREQTLPQEGLAGDLLTQGVALLERMLLAAEGHAGTLAPDIERLQLRVAALLGGDPSVDDGHETLATPSGTPQPGMVQPGTPQTGALQPADQTPVAVPDRAGQSIRVETRQLDGIMDSVGQMVMSRARLDRQLSRLTALEESLEASHTRVQRVVRDFEERYLNPDLARTTAGASDQPTTDAGQATGASELSTTVQNLFEELEFDSYDDMNILARSVTELSADLSELQGQFRANSAALRGESDTFSRLLRGLRRDVARTRRVPLSQAYTRPRRWARDQAHTELVTLGGEQEVDAFMTQGLSEVLLHLVTNAYTHGLEGPDERQRSGKPVQGRVTIDARRRGVQLDVSVSDDGRGIDVRGVREQALNRGLRSAQEAASLSDQDALRLIFLPGLSTARQVTNEAGRGVGMDIVASTVRRLGGELLVQSTPGQGTTFTMRLPLNQQVTDLLTVRVGPYPLGFPAGSVLRLREVAQDTLILQGNQRLLDDGTPLYLLQPLWNQSQPTGTLNVVVLGTTAGAVAFAVDRFEGIAEAVVAAPGPFLDALAYVVGTTVTPDGEPVLLSDPASLARYAGRVSLQPGVSLSGESGQAPAARRLLLIDDSLSVRRLVSKMLERAGYQVVTAADGQEALDLLREDSAFQAILTDLEMPRANGFEVIEEVRRRGMALPVVVMTTRAGEKHQRLAFQLGASDYFSKPVDEALLIRCLNRLIHTDTDSDWSAGQPVVGAVLPGPA